jgi:hypothetical protein
VWANSNTGTSAGIPPHIQPTNRGTWSVSGFPSYWATHEPQMDIVPEMWSGFQEDYVAGYSIRELAERWNTSIATEVHEWMLMLADETAIHPSIVTFVERMRKNVARRGIGEDAALPSGPDEIMQCDELRRWFEREMGAPE